MNKLEHLGATFLESKYGYRMSRETYVPDITPSVRELFTEKELKKFIKECYKNYDLNIEFFNKLDKKKFQKELNSFLSTHTEFKQCNNICETKDKTGYYIMVLDEYKQIYVGTTDTSIYDRLRRHMSKNQDFDRLIWGTWKDSKLSINSFRPLDTTRVYVYYTNKGFNHEDEYINCFDDDYILNRTIGGKLEFGLLEAFVNSKKRDLTKDI